MSIQTINENFLRTIIREFCKQKYPFQSSLKIVGSIHVVIDNNEVLSCLLNENLSSPMATSSDQLATRKSASATDNSNSEEEQKQCSDSNSVSSSSSSTTVNKLNKRKRFVPRAHPNEQTPAIEEKRKEEVEENNDDEENSENMVIDEGSFCDGENDAEQAKMKEENVCDDLEHEIKDQAIKKSVLGSLSSNKTTTTPKSKKRNGLNLQFSDVTNVVQTPPMQIGMGERATMSDGDEDEGEIKTSALGGILSKLVMHSAGKALTGAAANGDQSEFECTACDKKFKYFCYYKRHMDARHSEEPKFVCEFCYKTYKWEASYRHHLRQHQQNNVKIEIENKEN